MASSPVADDRDMAQVIEDAVQEPVTDRHGLNRIAAELITALVRLIVSIARGPITVIVTDIFNSNRITLAHTLLVELRKDPTFIAQVQGGMQLDIDEKVRDEVDRHIQRIEAEREARDQEILRRVAEKTVTRRSYIFAPLFTLIGGVLGALGFWGVTTRFQAGIVTDAAGQEWVATSILADPGFITLFIVIGFFLFAGIGAGIGLVIDIVRDRRR